MRYRIESTKEILYHYVARGVMYKKKRTVPTYIGVLNPFGDYMIMDTIVPKESIWHTDQDIMQVELILNKEGINYSLRKFNKNEKLPTGIVESKSYLDRFSDNYDTDYSGRQDIRCQACEGTGWIHEDMTCPDCEP